MKKILLSIFCIFIIFYESYSIVQLDSSKLKKMFDSREFWRADTTLQGLDTLKRYFDGINILCCDSLNCAAFYTGGLGSIVFKTTDGGNNWKLVLDDGIPSIFDLPLSRAFPSPDFIIISYGGDSLQRTINGGVNWDTINTHFNSQFNRMDFLSNGIGLATGWNKTTNTNNTFFRTTDYGTTWEELPPVPNIEVVTYPKLFSDSVYSCMAYNHDPWEYYYCRSYDAGKTWDQYQYNSEKLLSFPFFIDSLNGWAFTYKPYIGYNIYNVIYHTSNGGRTWEKQLDTLVHPQFNLTSISFIDTLNGICLGKFGKVFITNNGGKTWIHDTAISKKIYEEAAWVQYLTPKRFIILNTLGRVFIYNEDGFTGIDNHSIFNDFDINTMQIYPNPATDKATITFPIEQAIENIKIELYNNYGEKVKFINNNASDKIEIYVGDLPTGVYFAVLNRGKDRKAVGFVVAK